MYKYYKAGNKIICVSSYAGKMVRGVAKCHPGDTYDEEYGMRLAKARCDAKVTAKRYQNADNKWDEASKAVAEAERHLEKMSGYVTSAQIEFLDAMDHLDDVLAERVKTK